jgi:hypothetical protein
MGETTPQSAPLTAKLNGETVLIHDGQVYFGSSSRQENKQNLTSEEEEEDEDESSDNDSNAIADMLLQFLQNKKQKKNTY